MRIAQPAISRQIASLEGELGVKLFVRTTTRVRLTDAGRHFHQEVDRILAQLSIAVTGAQEIAGGRGGELNLGSDWRILMPQIPEAVLRYRAVHPRVTVNFVELPVHAQLNALREGQIHLGFVHKAAIGASNDFDSISLGTAEMKAAVSVRHRLADTKSVALHDLKDETWVKLDEKNHPGYRAFMIQLCHPALFTPKFGRMAKSIDGMLALVTMGDGICLVPTSLLTRAHAGLRLLDTDCPPFEFHAIWPKKSPAGPRSDFLKILKESLHPSPPESAENARAAHRP